MPFFRGNVDYIMLTYYYFLKSESEYSNAAQGSAAINCHSPGTVSCT